MVIEPLDSVADLLADFEPGLSPADDGEEELEWISNREAFPPLETFVPAQPTPQPPLPPSPVSVLPLEPPLLKAPARARSKIRRRKRRFFSPTVQVPVRTPPAEISVPAGGRRRCQHCESEVTPQWRAGPDGPKTLCNACGVRYKSGRLFPEYRPANSPTFSAALHSNSHRRIMEMRRRTGPGSGTGTGSGRRGRPRLVIL